MSDTRESKVRRYRYGEPRRAGLFGTLAWTMLVPLIVALAAAWLAVAGFVAPPFAVPVVAAGVWLALGRVRGRPAHAVLPAMLSFGWRRLRHRHRWFRPVPLLTDGELPVKLPPPLAGLALFELDVPGLMPGRAVPAGVVHDRPAHTVTGVLRVHGDGQFSLLDALEQDVRLDGWGAALGGFARERCDVIRAVWHDWAAPVPVADQIGQLQSRWADEPVSPARSSYLALMEVVAPKVTEHDLLLEVTVAVGRRRQTGRSTGLSAALATLTEELALFSSRLDAAGLQVTGVLSASDVVTATRGRSDPVGMEQLATYRHSLAAAAGAAPPTFGPFFASEELTVMRVDRSVHRTWWFARWPRREVPAGWLDKLIFECGCTRTVTAVYEPIPPSRSDANVDRELVASRGEHRVPPSAGVPGDRQGPQGARRGRASGGGAELGVP